MKHKENCPVSKEKQAVGTFQLEVDKVFCTCEEDYLMSERLKSGFDTKPPLGDIRRMSPSALVDEVFRDKTEVNVTDYIYSRSEDEQGNPIPQYYSVKIFNSDTRISKGIDIDICFFSELFKKQGDKNLSNFIQDIIHIYKEVNKIQ